MSARPNFAGYMGAFVKEAVETGHPEDETADNEWL